MLHALLDPMERKFFPTLLLPYFGVSITDGWKITHQEETVGYLFKRQNKRRTALRNVSKASPVYGELIIAIHPAHRRRGLALWALKHLPAELTQCLAFVNPANPAALKLFTQAGWPNQGPNDLRLICFGPAQ